MKNSPSISQSLAPIAHFIRRFHYIIFFVILGSLLAAGMLVVVSIVNGTQPTETPTQPLSSSFDQATIDRLETLSSRSASPSVSLPKGVRVNPFVE